MTAPAVATPAPVIQDTPSVAEQVAHDPKLAMEHTISSTLAQANETDASTERQRDASGKFVSASSDGQPITQQTPPAPDAQPGTDGESEGEGTDPVIEVPEGYTLAQPLPEDKARGFSVRDAEGEIVPPDLTWELTANGKPRTLSTDKLVAYAQMGVYNHEREQAFEQAQTQTHQLHERTQQLEQAYQDRQQVIERLLSDPDYLIQSLTAYEQQNTPEARAQRAQQELAEQRQQIEVQRMEQQAEHFVNGELAPALDTIATQLSTVSREELAARVFMASQRYRVNGILSPQGFQPLQHYILNDLVPWARQLHEARETERQAPQAAVKAVEAQAKTDIEKAQVRAQKSRRQLAHALRPAGRAMPDSQPQKPIRNNKDAEDAVIGNALASFRAG